MANGWTFGSLIAEGMRVTAFCQNSRCNNNQQLDLKALAAKFGRTRRPCMTTWCIALKCTKCGGRQIGLTYTPTVRPTGSPYLSEKGGR
jgi:hypothetical protein